MKVKRKEYDTIQKFTLTWSQKIGKEGQQGTEFEANSWAKS